MQTDIPSEIQALVDLYGDPELVFDIQKSDLEPGQLMSTTDRAFECRPKNEAQRTILCDEGVYFRATGWQVRERERANGLTGYINEIVRDDQDQLRVLTRQLCATDFGCLKPAADRQPVHAGSPPRNSLD